MVVLHGDYPDPVASEREAAQDLQLRALGVQAPVVDDPRGPGFLQDRQWPPCLAVHHDRSVAAAQQGRRLLGACQVQGTEGFQDAPQFASPFQERNVVVPGVEAAVKARAASVPTERGVHVGIRFHAYTGPPILLLEETGVAAVRAVPGPRVQEVPSAQAGQNLTDE